MVQIRTALLIGVLDVALLLSASAQGRKFFPDDPIQAVPPPLPVINPLDREIDQMYDFFVQSKDTDADAAIRSSAINTLDEVPNSEWFTNRHGRHRMARAELQRGPGPDEEPIAPFTITSGKDEGISPGFTMKDSKGRTYFVKFDPRDYPELTTTAEVVVSKFLYAIGYNTPKNEIVNLKLSDLSLSGNAKIALAGGRSRRMTWKDVEGMVRTIARRPDGSFRAVASRAIDGHNVGPFRYQGTRRDDPNDVVPHEHRRDLRGLYVFSAWLNNTDARSGNTLDALVDENGIQFIRHYLIDFGSALGSDGDRPKDARLGNRFMLPTPTEAITDILSLGLFPKPWERTHFSDLAIGRFESGSFEPDQWTSNYPNPAFLSRRPDDDFWAAKQVMTFTNGDIRAIVETARLTDFRAAEYIIATLAQRRDKIGRVFFSKVLPLDHFRVVNSELLFDDLPVKYGFKPPQDYTVQWFRFDNMRQTHDSISAAPRSTSLPDEARQAPPGAYFSAVITSPSNNMQTVRIYIHKENESYKVVGIERTW